MVLDGTVQGDGKAIDVRIHLNDVREHVVLWSGEFHGSADATETLEASVAAQAADVLYWARTGRSGKVKLDAATFAAFIAGREGTTGVRNTGDGVDLADYRKVVAAAPDFSWGHSGVAAMEGFELRESSRHCTPATMPCAPMRGWRQNEPWRWIPTMERPGWRWSCPRRYAIGRDGRHYCFMASPPIRISSRSR